MLQHFYIFDGHFLRCFYSPMHAAHKRLYTFNKGHGKAHFRTLLATFFVTYYRKIVCFRTIFSRKTKFNTKRASLQELFVISRPLGW